MPTYTAPQRDIKFVMQELLDIGKLAKLPSYEDATPDLLDALLEEAAKMCENELQPLNLSGDSEGCHFENGVVRTPKGFKEAYDKFVEGGWLGLAANPKYGGQGLPYSYQFMLEEMISASNLALGMYPGLSHGAIEAIDAHGNDTLKDLYLPKMIEGIWSGTMCLTEAHCGTDLGLIRTKAENPQADGSAIITGSKIFISAGEHDLTENIIHLVLAKLPNAPKGVHGISLFLVPKFLPDANGEVGEANAVTCGSIEHKMGIKASATCVINFDNSKGWLVGEPHKGLKAMFTMMNAARLAVGLQGLSQAEVAYQNAVTYAKERLQGRSLTGIKYPEKVADPIIVHPDVRRNLLTIKAYTEGARALAYWIGMEIDRSHKHPDADERQKADDLVSLMTPVIKGFFTDYGFEATTMAQQVYGGHGYIHEWGMEQFVRDARITQIYEGANGIQALDLVGRKMPKSFGRLLRRFFQPVNNFLEENQSNPELMEFLFPFMKGFGKLQQATALTAQKGMKNPDEAGAASTDYLRLFALVAVGFMWLKMVKTATEKLADDSTTDKEFYKTKLKTARFYFQKLYHQTGTLFLNIAAGGDTLMDFDENEF